MTYGRVRHATRMHDPKGAAVSHLAELVRGYLPLRAQEIAQWT